MKLGLILLFALIAGAGRVLAADTNAAPEAARPVASPALARRATATAVVPSPRNDSSVAPSAIFTYDSFRLITDRNIFNPNRSGRRDRTAEEIAPPRTDVISLVGTMDSDNGLRAFFDGSEPAFRKALHVGESIDKYKVAQIAPMVVDLERDGKTLSVRVGQQLRRPDGADWNLVGEDVARREAQARAAAEAKVDPNAPPAIPADADEVTKRLMQKRAQQLKQ